MIGDLSQDLRQVRVSGNDRIAAGLAHLSRREMLGLHGIKGATAVAVETGDCQPPKMFDQLVAVGRGDLALVRLFEGHVNAAQFVNRLGSAAQRARVATLLETGGLLGVWGADDPIQPARISMADGHNKLAGRKTYASGAGVVGLGIVAAKTEQSQTQLMLLDTTADLQSRFDASWWRPIGMQASASHALSLEGLDVSSGELFGTPGQFRGRAVFQRWSDTLCRRAPGWCTRAVRHHPRAPPARRAAVRSAPARSTGDHDCRSASGVFQRP